MSCCCSNYLPCLGAETSSRSSAGASGEGVGGGSWHVRTQRASVPTDDPPTVPPHKHTPHHHHLSPPIRPSSVTHSLRVIIGSSRSHLYCSSGACSMRRRGKMENARRRKVIWRSGDGRGRGMKQGNEIQIELVGAELFNV